MLNNTLNALHYEVSGVTGMKMINAKAAHNKTTLQHLKTTGNKFDHQCNGNVFVLNNGKDGSQIDQLIEAMELELLAMDAFFHKEGQVLVKYEVQNNCGFSIGITGDQLTSKKFYDVAKPSVMRVTQRYGYLFLLMLQVMEHMAEQAGVDSYYKDNDTILQEHMDSWTWKCSMDPDNKL